MVKNIIIISRVLCAQQTFFREFFTLLFRSEAFFAHRMNRMIQLWQIRWILFDLFDHLHALIGDCPNLWIFLLEVLIPCADQCELLERKCDRLETFDGCDERKVSDGDVIGNCILLANSSQVLFKHFESAMDLLEAGSVARILWTSRKEKEIVKKWTWKLNHALEWHALWFMQFVSTDAHIKENWRNRVGRYGRIQMCHVEAKPLIDQRTKLRLFRIHRWVGRILITNVLHDRDMLRDEKSIVVQHWDFLLRIELEKNE